MVLTETSCFGRGVVPEKETNMDQFTLIPQEMLRTVFSKAYLLVPIGGGNLTCLFYARDPSQALFATGMDQRFAPEWVVRCLPATWQQAAKSWGLIGEYPGLWGSATFIFVEEWREVREVDGACQARGMKGEKHLYSRGASLVCVHQKLLFQPINQYHTMFIDDHVCSSWAGEMHPSSRSRVKHAKPARLDLSSSGGNTVFT